ncbi:hypothetical protein VCR5J5_1370255 [Vibrio crassostreae]|uniref:Uncharacterized protein n=1 Tax=Vibrio crassostreae TaxID=246167 RepID=A0A822MNZ7_9VIBR|nr:hypothetical protein VCR5J5_1370255 [Vibrio crassostreae]
MDLILALLFFQQHDFYRVIATSVSTVSGISKVNGEAFTFPLGWVLFPEGLYLVYQQAFEFLRYRGVWRCDGQCLWFHGLFLSIVIYSVG